RCSSSLIVEASPVVPATTNPSEPLSAKWRISATNASSLTFASAPKGVTIAVRIVPRSFIRCSIPRARGPVLKAGCRSREQQALQADRQRLGQAAHAAHGEQHPGHERLPADRVVADAQRL